MSKEFKCEICGKICKSSQGLANHKRMAHNSGGAGECTTHQWRSLTNSEKYNYFDKAGNSPADYGFDVICTVPGCGVMK